MLNKTTFEDEVVVIFPAAAKAPRLARENFPPFQGTAAWKNESDFKKTETFYILFPFLW